MTDEPKQYKCRKCGGLSWFLFEMDRPHRPTLIRCKGCGHEEIL